MEVRRTVQVRLDVADSDTALLEETVAEFLFAANAVIDHAWKGDRITTNKSQLQSETYEDIRARTPLIAGLVQNARNKAADALTSVIARWSNGQRAGKPHFSKPTVWYDHRTATFYDDHVTLATTAGRVEAEYVLPKDIDGTPIADYLLNRGYEITGAELHLRGDDWYLHVRTKADVEPDTPEQATIEHNTVLGVDLGVNNLAVTSSGTFWNADEFNHWRREYERRRANLHRCGSRWAHENIKAVGREEAGRFTTLLHRIANQLVAEAYEYGCTVIAVESLTGIRERLGASWGHVWAFKRLLDYIEYKAADRGIAVERVNPENTSQRCSNCGFTHPSNRDKNAFACQRCGYENHADYNAAKNIGLRYLRRNQNGGDGGAPLGVRLNSGMMNVNGSYSPASSEARTGVHAETDLSGCR